MDDLKTLNEVLRKGMDSPFFASVIIVSPDRQHLLLAKRKDDKGWTMPGGGANIGESPKTAAIREAFEESNVFLWEDLLQELHVAPVFGDRFCHVFLAVLDGDQTPGVQNDPDEEVRKWIWHPISEPLPQPMSEARRNSCAKAIFELARQRAQEAFLEALEQHEISIMEKGMYEKPIGSLSSSGKYKKVGSGDWRKVGGHGDPSPDKPGVDKTPSDKPIHTVDVKFKHQGKEYSHSFSVPAQSTDQAWTLVEGKIKAMESKIGPVELTGKTIKPAKVEKSLAENEMTGTNIDTTHQAMEGQAVKDSVWVDRIKAAFPRDGLNTEPGELPLDFPWALHAIQTDDGIYDGHVKNRDSNSGESGEVVFQIKKMTLPAMLEALRAKEYVSEPPALVPAEVPEEKTDAHGIQELMDILKEAVRAPHTININFYKSLSELNKTLKGLL